MTFRQDLRAWLEGHPPPPAPFDVEAHRAWNAALFDAGYARPAWPVRFGGRDADLADQLAWVEELARVDAPGPVNAIGVANIGPAIMAFGSEEQQERFLRPMLRGDELWSQGMSEPEAGSDLAALRCRGELDGDHIVVNGEKTWNSMGDRADWCQLYVRTDSSGRKHEGITCLLVDMRLPGIEARPIVTMAGDASFSQLFFTDVRVPLDAVLGEVGGGWAVATTTLSNERAGVAGLSLKLQRKLDRLLAGRPGSARQELAQRVIEARCLELLARRSLAARRPGPEGSVIKLAWSQAEQALAATAAESTLEGPTTTALLSSRSLSIAGGTTEVNKNIIAERVLGLPR